MKNTNYENKLNNNVENNQKTKTIAYLMIIAAASLWGTIGIFIKELNEFGFAPLQIVFIRAIGAFVILMILLLIKDIKLIKIKPRDSIYFVGTGILSFTFFNWCYFIAINKTSLSAAAILLYTAPALVMILSVILFKERITKRKIISLILTFVGCIFVTAFVQGTNQNITVIGILAGLGSGIGYALYSIFGRYALEKYDPITITLYTFIFSSISLILITDIKEMINLFSNTRAIYYSLALSSIATVLPFLLYTKGLTHLDTSKASIIATLEPIVATIIGITLYSEPITFFKTAGILIVLFAVYIIREK